MQQKVACVREQRQSVLCFFILTSGETLTNPPHQIPLQLERERRKKQKEDPRHVGWGPKQRENEGSNHSLFKHDFLCNTPLAPSSLSLSLSLDRSRIFSGTPILPPPQLSCSYSSDPASCGTIASRLASDAES
ncbi:hypothetical protein GW17_00000462 [Ensete ventricosum]|nr:hypothetical protein GW17_00000462 [Ensete ventricosum]